MMPPIVDSFLHSVLAKITGVCPVRAQVLPKIGFMLKPTSSAQTIVSPASTFFFQGWKFFFQPGIDLLRILLDRVFLCFLPGEAPATK
ncbi:hypothetical protein A2G07_15485 (plasmid) [Deinococcus radiodurans R1 = ATCC 13939 = DSM 20539]|nr:hypothetical protein A2G07_05955 [Deinococcus radiodurans R1 = ATCC 13939 = DSM 20539]ANC73250.1 hypothetical protein A2G07_15485 [Deinococcus radiodurans R1 = ATCC 13939 = DSM 20539]